MSRANDVVALFGPLTATIGGQDREGGLPGVLLVHRDACRRDQARTGGDTAGWLMLRSTVPDPSAEGREKLWPLPRFQHCWSSAQTFLKCTALPAPEWGPDTSHCTSASSTLTTICPPMSKLAPMSSSCGTGTRSTSSPASVPSGIGGTLRLVCPKV